MDGAGKAEGEGLQQAVALPWTERVVKLWRERAQLCRDGRRGWDTCEPDSELIGGENGRRPGLVAPSDGLCVPTVQAAWPPGERFLRPPANASTHRLGMLLLLLLLCMLLLLLLWTRRRRRRAGGGTLSSGVEGRTVAGRVSGSAAACPPGTKASCPRAARLGGPRRALLLGTPPARPARRDDDIMDDDMMMT